LANSYFNLNKFEEAIEMYKKRISMGGWNEEVWYSYFRLGHCYKNMGKMADALWNWFEGYEYYPDRLEGLFEILHYYRNNGKNKRTSKIIYYRF
jgi:tetratricopeptide (TPR) repeat protein